MKIVDEIYSRLTLRELIDVDKCEIRCSNCAYWTKRSKRMGECGYWLKVLKVNLEHCQPTVQLRTHRKGVCQQWEFKR